MEPKLMPVAALIVGGCFFALSGIGSPPQEGVGGDESYRAVYDLLNVFASNREGEELP